MSTVTFTLDPEVDDYDTMRAMLDGVYGVTAEETGPASPTAKHTEAEEVMPNGWTKKRMAAYLANVKEGGRDALRIIADNAPEIGFSEVQEAMGYGPDEAATYGGRMTTLAHAANRTRGVKSKPFDQDYSTRTYQIDPKIAALVIEVLDEMAA